MHDDVNHTYNRIPSPPRPTAILSPFVPRPRRRETETIVNSTTTKTSGSHARDEIAEEVRREAALRRAQAEMLAPFSTISEPNGRIRPTRQQLHDVEFALRSDFTRISICKHTEKLLRKAQVSASFVQRFFVVNDDLDDDAVWLSGALQSAPLNIHSASENIVRGLIDRLVMCPMEFLGTLCLDFALCGQRDLCDCDEDPTNSTVADDMSSLTVAQDANRLGFRLSHKITKMVVFFGEEKAGREELSDDHASRRVTPRTLAALDAQKPTSAKQDLLCTERVCWSEASFGCAEYIVVYTCCGKNFQMYTYHRDDDATPPGQAAMTKLWRPLDLTNREHRLELIVRVVYIFRLLRSIVHDCFPTSPIPVNKTLVTIRPGCIRKDLSKGSRKYWGGKTGKTYAELKDLYATISDPGRAAPDSLIRGVFKSSHVVLLSPVGYLRQPETIAELLVALVDVLTALRWLHNEARWVHRDIRWSNVLKRGSDRWLLIDYEGSAPLRNLENGGAPATWGAAWPDDKMLSPAYKPKPSQPHWTPKHDLWQVAHLLVERCAVDGTKALSEGIERAADASAALSFVRGLMQ